MEIHRAMIRMEKMKRSANTMRRQGKFIKGQRVLFLFEEKKLVYHSGGR
jgi:hypothetical protein